MVVNISDVGKAFLSKLNFSTKMLFAFQSQSIYEKMSFSLNFGYEDGDDYFELAYSSNEWLLSFQSGTVEYREISKYIRAGSATMAHLTISAFDISDIVQADIINKKKSVGDFIGFGGKLDMLNSSKQVVEISREGYGVIRILMFV